MIVTGDFCRDVVAGSNRPDSRDHGERHWIAVAENGLGLIGMSHVADDRDPLAAAADPELVLLFALFHDTRRENEYVDPEHGLRAAQYARQKLDGIIPSERLRTLALACERHDQGTISLDPTEAVCFDADRLDLGRVGIDPDPAYLSTHVGRFVCERMDLRDAGTLTDWDVLVQAAGVLEMLER